jgi:hypothetical protein
MIIGTHGPTAFPDIILSKGDVMNHLRTTLTDTKVPLSQRLLVPVSRVPVKGSYSTDTDTWSNRLFEDATTKKHNEDM